MSRLFTVIDAEQRSPAWFAARLGRLTGSRAKDALATIQKGEAAARRDYRLQLVCERITGQQQEDTFVNDAMQRGITCEPLAFAAYEACTGQMVQRTGFLAHTTHMSGCSLDGHIGDFEGLIELKCPKSATHLKYLRAGTVPAEHLAQMTCNLWIAGAAWCDFVSYDDRFGDGALQLFIVRLERDERAIAAFELAALAFLDEVTNECEAVATMADVGAQLKAAVA